MDTKRLLSQIQLCVVFKLNHDPLGPEENAGCAVNCDVERAVVAGGERPPGCSFELFFPAQVVADNLMGHTKKKYQKMGISVVTLHPTTISKVSTWKAPLEQFFSCSSTELRKQGGL